MKLEEELSQIKKQQEQALISNGYMYYPSYDDIVKRYLDYSIKITPLGRAMSEE